MIELFDVVDKHGQPTGQTVTREEAHKNGVPHRTVHVWVARVLDHTGITGGSASLNQDGITGSSAALNQAGITGSSAALNQAGITGSSAALNQADISGSSAALNQAGITGSSEISDHSGNTGSSEISDHSRNPSDSARAKKVQVLLQKRSAAKETFPGCYETSSSGHIQAGEAPIDAALREFAEELGIHTDADHLRLLGTFHTYYAMEFNGKMIRDDETGFVFLYAEPIDITQLTLQESEVESAHWFDIDDVLESIAEPRDPNYCVEEGGIRLVKEYIESL